uniref:peroxidase n=1 Tax=Solanum tuberosum TaxID=4113 RepID=M1BRD3_SOLTU
MTSKALFFGVLLFSALSAFAEEKEDDNPGLVMDYYKRTCPQAEENIKEQVNLLYKQQQNNAFSWLRNVFHDCFVELGGPYIPLKTGRRDGRRSRADILEQHLPSHNESISVVLERFANIGINTPGAVALLGCKFYVGDGP